VPADWGPVCLNMEPYLFYILAGLTLVCGLLVVANPFSRNPVTSAMFLALTIASLAGLFVMLHAFFLAAVQILVYAGAVMVLFLFVIMLLNPQEEERRSFRKAALGIALLAVGSLAALMLRTIDRSSAGAGLTPELEGGTQELGRLLFTQYLLPFEIVSVLLLVGMVGVIVLSKKEGK
jgi:NADH-quinone oxidoreductase subunit J